MVPYPVNDRRDFPRISTMSPPVNIRCVNRFTRRGAPLASVARKPGLAC